MKYINIKIKKELFSLLTVLCLSAVLGACSDEKTYEALDEASILTEIKLNVTNPLPLLIGTDSVISYSVAPDYATTKEIVWSSDDTEIATVDETGRISAHKVGEVTIRARSKAGYVATASLKVQVISEIIKATGITVIPENPEAYETSTLQLKAVLSPETVTYSTVKWISETPDIASVSETGMLLGLKSGIAKIKVAAIDGSGIAQTVEVLVKPVVPVTDIIIEDQDRELALYEVSKLNIKVQPEGATSSALHWYSANSKVVNIDEYTGVFTAGMYGTTTLTAKLGDFEKSFDVSVVEGKINDTFMYGNNWDIWSGNASKIEVTGEVESDKRLTVSPVFVGGLNYKGLIYRKGETTFVPATYPIIAACIKYKGKRDGGPNYLVNIWNTKNSGWGGYYAPNGGAKNNAMHKISLNGDKGIVHYFDLNRTDYTFGSVRITSKTTIDRYIYEIWEMKYDDEGDNFYDMYWVKSFKSEDELKEYLKKENLID